MFAGFILLFIYTRRGYTPHSKTREEIFEFNWEKKKTPYLFGILAGFAPCIFEFLIYSQCLTYSLGSGLGFIDGIFTVFYFSLGTFVGLFPLALAKQGSLLIVKPKMKRKNLIFYIMILIIIVFNTVVMLLSFLRISVFPVVRF